MRHVRDVMRLKSAGIPTREIARRVGAAPSTVRLTIRRFEAAGLTWPLSDDITDTELEARLFASAGAGPGTRRGHRRQAEPDWAAVHRELRRKHVTLSIVWEEYIAGEPGGYRYSRFCELYRAWEGRLSVTMRQSHAAGDKLFVDYAGDGVPVVIDRLTGERRSAQIFVAVLGASSFTYAQATWTQGLADWISGHVGAFEAIGGVPALLVPDNTKVAVIKACLYDPQINRSYADMAAHYGTAILPARPRRPRDKAKVEQAVLMVERWLLGRLRQRTFHSLAEVNAAIAEMLTRLNEERPIRRLGVTRRKLLEEIDRPVLKDLPDSPYVFAEWRICRVSIDYHVEVEAHYYSVPHRFVRAEVEARFTARTVEMGRDLSSRQTQQVVKDLEIGQPINSENCSETAEGVARESEGRSRVSLLRPVRQDQPRRHPGACLCPVPLQQGRTGGGRPGLRGHRRVRGAAVAWRTGACSQARDLPTGPHQKSVHTEGQRQTQAAGHLDRAGSGLHDSSNAGAGTDLRSRPSTRTVRVPSRAKRPAGGDRGGRAAVPRPSGSR